MSKIKMRRTNSQGRSVLSVLSVAYVLSVLSVAVAAAQIQTGSIIIKAVDEQGAVIPGVTVTVSSPVLPRELNADHGVPLPDATARAAGHPIQRVVRVRTTVKYQRGRAPRRPRIREIREIRVP